MKTVQQNEFKYSSHSLLEEPWIDFPSGEELQSWKKEDQVIYNQRRRQIEKQDFFASAFDFTYTNQISGDYLEFGCHRVRTFRMALTEARRQNLDSMRFFAFDSFEGLPEIENREAVAVDFYNKGALTTSEDEFLAIVRKHGVYADKVRTIKGFFQHSLSEDLKKNLLKNGVKVSIACVDCDLYESAVPVFHFVEEFLQPGSVIYIDDYYVGYKGSPFDGVGKAFREFQDRSAFSFAQYMNVGFFGKSFICCKK